MKQSVYELQVIPRFAIGVMCLLATACGGGGSTPAPAPQSGNSAPQFSSPTTASVKENTSGVIYTVAARDTDGDRVSFSIAGGADSNSFTLSGASLSFKEIPDFERPTDSNRDNLYNVTLTAQDARGGSANIDLVVSITNDKEGIKVTRIATGFSDPTGLEPLLLSTGNNDPIEGLIAVAQANGEIFNVNGTTGTRTLLTNVFSGRSRGKLLAIGWGSQRRSYYSALYAASQEPDGRVFVESYNRNKTRLYELEVLPTGSPRVSATILDGPPAEPNFSGAGYREISDLYMTISDEGGTYTKNPNLRLGKLLLLEKRDPFAGASLSFSLTARIIGTGIRRSGGAGALNGQILLSDQGASLEHEMTFFPADARPLDFGWPSREGTQGIGANPPAPVNSPTIAYEFGNGVDQGTGIIFGGLYTGPVADLNNSFVFGDTGGTIWSIPFAELTSGFLLRPQQMDRRTQDFVPDIGKIESPVAFTIDDMGRMFILDADGELFRVDAS